jgi:hypothetical protein
MNHDRALTLENLNITLDKIHPVAMTGFKDRVAMLFEIYFELNCSKTKMNLKNAFLIDL